MPKLSDSIESEETRIAMAKQIISLMEVSDSDDVLPEISIQPEMLIAMAQQIVYLTQRESELESQNSKYVGAAFDRYRLEQDDHSKNTRSAYKP